MATKVPQPAPAFPWHNGPSATPCSLPKVSPHILLLAWCLAELLLNVLASPGANRAAQETVHQGIVTASPIQCDSTVSGASSARTMVGLRRPWC